MHHLKAVHTTCLASDRGTRDHFDMTMQTLAEALTSNQGSWEAERASRISSRQSRLERIQKRNEALSGFSIPRSIQRLAESSEED